MPPKQIYIAGHEGMVGSALYRRLSGDPDQEIVFRTHAQLDLTDQSAVQNFFSTHKIEEVYLAAGRVGGIHANDNYPANFIYDNLMIECNIIHSAYQFNVKKLLFLGSSCIYPRMAKQPIHESQLLTGALEPTNEAYAMAKIAGIKLSESYNRQYGVDYRSVMPTNLYGQNDNFHPRNSHVIPAMMRRLHKAKSAGDGVVSIWGSGKPMREFLHVDDLADACILVMGLTSERYRSVVQPRLSHINIGTGEDCTIRDLAKTMAGVIGFTGELQFDTSKPDGTPRKLLDVQRLNSLGWRPSISLRQGLCDTYAWYLENEATLRSRDV